jgi:hypothetical protein
MSVSSTVVATARERDWLQVAAAGVFLVLAAIVIGLQVENSLDLANVLGVRGAREGRRYFAVYVAIVFACGGLAAFMPRRLLWTAPALGGLGAAVALVAVATAGGEGWSIFAAVLTLTAAWLIGRTGFDLPGLRTSGLAASGMASLAAGLGLLGLVVFLLGLVGLIRWWTVGLLTVVGGPAGLVLLLRSQRWRALPASVTSTRFRAGAAGILGVQLAYATVWAGAPEVEYDALQYKAWLPAHWAFTGEIDAATFTDNPRSVYLGLAQLVATPGHAVGAPGVGRYLQLALAVLFAVVVWRLGSRFAPAVGAIGALVVALAPQVLWQTTTAYDDLFLTALVLGGGLAILHYEGRRVSAPFWASAGIGFLAGTCVTGKLHLIPFALALAGVWCVIASSWGDLGRRLAGCAAGAAVGALPVLVYRWVITGNPVFPYYNQVFGSSFFRTDEGFTDFTSGSRGGAGAAGSFFWDLVAEVPRGIEVAAPGVFGLLVVAVFIAVGFGWRGDVHRRAVWGATVMSLIVWWAVFRYLRFALPLAILATVLALPALAGLGRLVRSRAGTIAGLLAACVAAGALIVSAMATLWNIPGRWPVAVAAGAESERSYLSRALVDYAPLGYLGAHARPGDGIIGQVWGRMLLPLDVNLKWAYELEGEAAVISELADDPERFKQALDERGFRWVVLADDGRQYTDDYFLAPLLDRYGQVAFADHLRDVYELVEQPRQGVPVELCDETFSKPECWFGATLPDGTSGVTAAELQYQPIGQTVPVCAGATYRLTVRSGPGADPFRVFYVFDVPEPAQAVREGDVWPDRTVAINQTAPEGATSVSLVLQPLGPDASLESMQLERAAPPEDGSACA